MGPPYPPVRAVAARRPWYARSLREGARTRGTRSRSAGRAGRADGREPHDRDLPIGAGLVSGVPRVGPHGSTPQPVTFVAADRRGLHTVATAADVDLGTGILLQVEVPVGVAGRPSVGGDHDVGVAVRGVRQRGLAGLTGAATGGVQDEEPTEGRPGQEW